MKKAERELVNNVLSCISRAIYELHEAEPKVIAGLPNGNDSLTRYERLQRLLYEMQSAENLLKYL